MASSQYRLGADFENRTRERFEEVGYYVVRSAGSKGVADLVAFDLMADRITRHPVPVMIQCKRGKNGLGVEAWNHFYSIADAAGCLALVAQKRDGRTLEADLWEITATRTPRGRHKPWIPWPLRKNPGITVVDVPLPGDTLQAPLPLPHLTRRPHVHVTRDLPPQLCSCGHSRDEHFMADLKACESCYCDTFKEW